MIVSCDQGKGSIILSDQNHYRGDGICAGWSDDHLKATYQSLMPKDESRFELIQLG